MMTEEAWTQKQADGYVYKITKAIQEAQDAGHLKDYVIGIADSAVLALIEQGYGWHGLWLMDYVTKLTGTRHE